MINKYNTCMMCFYFTRIASNPCNLDFCCPSRTIMKGLPYSSVAYTAELGSIFAEAILKSAKGGKRKEGGKEFKLKKFAR